MKFDKDLLKEKWVAYTVALCSAVVLYMVLTHLNVLGHLLAGIWKIGSPVFMALVIAYVMAPLVGMYSKYVLHRVEQEKLRHTLSVLLAVLSVVLFFVILMVALVPQVIDSIVMFVGNLNIYVLSFQQFMRQLSSFAAHHDIDLSQFISSSDEMLQSISRILPENLNKIVNASYGFGAKLFDWIISFILAIYLMLDGQNLRFGFMRLLHALLPSGVYASSASFWRRCNTILIRYIACDLLDGMIIGLLNWVFMVIMQMPYVAIISVVVGVTNLAPTFGPMAGAVIGAFILVLVKPVYALWFLLFTLVLQTVDGYVIKPRLFGEQLGVSSVWILIALVVGGRLLGVAGILLAIPFAAIGDYVYHDYVLKNLELQKNERRKQREAALSGMKAASGITAEAVAQAAGEAAAQAAGEAAAAAAAQAAGEAAAAAVAAIESAKAAAGEAAGNAADAEAGETVAEAASENAGARAGETVVEAASENAGAEADTINLEAEAAADTAAGEAAGDTAKIPADQPL